MKENILDYPRPQLVEWLDSKGVRSFRAGQIFKWIYLRQANGFEEMTDLGKPMRAVLDEHFYLNRLVLEKKQSLRIQRKNTCSALKTGFMWNRS